MVAGLAVSISHSTHLVAVAAAFTGPVGVDLEERVPREYEALARRWFTAGELSWMNTQPDPFHAFLHLWTAKEAVGKSLGQGLHGGGLRRRIPLPPATIIEDQVVVTHPPLPDGAVLAVAVPIGTRELLITSRTRTATSRTRFPVIARSN